MALTLDLLDLEAFGEGVARAFPRLKAKTETLFGLARVTRYWGSWLGLAVARKIAAIRLGRSYSISYSRRLKKLGEYPNRPRSPPSTLSVLLVCSIPHFPSTENFAETRIWGTEILVTLTFGSYSAQLVLDESGARSTPEVPDGMLTMSNLVDLYKSVSDQP